MRPREEVEKIKKLFPVGTRVRLIQMDDSQAVPSGILGTVDYIDDDGQIHMNWDNGRTLALIYGVDQFEIV
ncbi:MAG: DUF4314 domain-containing protein [Bacilli bacterium]|nr:DUF4314 domain-containing protein [Bacilli bacterium]